MATEILKWVILFFVYFENRFFCALLASEAVPYQEVRLWTASFLCKSHLKSVAHFPFRKQPFLDVLQNRPEGLKLY